MPEGELPPGAQPVERPTNQPRMAWCQASCDLTELLSLSEGREEVSRLQANQVLSSVDFASPNTPMAQDNLFGNSIRT